MGTQINDTVTSQGIFQEVDDICHSNTTSYPVVSKTRRANFALSDFTGIALNSDDRWQFDDTNYDEYPIGTTDLVIGQRDYALTVDMLKVLKIDAKDSSGNWYELKPIDRNDSEVPLDGLFETSGTPIYYDKFANSPFLYPAPSYNSTDGLRVTFQRDAEYFTTSDTTKKPGIPSIFHKYIALKIAEPYLRDNRKENYVSVRNEIQKYEEMSIPEFYSKRNKDERPAITGRIIDCK